jgi:hypothetical protein
MGTATRTRREAEEALRRSLNALLALYETGGRARYRTRGHLSRYRAIAFALKQRLQASAEWHAEERPSSALVYAVNTYV